MQQKGSDNLIANVGTFIKLQFFMRGSICHKNLINKCVSVHDFQHCLLLYDKPSPN